MKSDKGNEVIIVNGTIYIYMCQVYMKLLMMSQHFWNFLPTLLSGEEENFEDFYIFWARKVFLSKEQYGNIYPSGSQPARLYRNPKTRKLKSGSDKLTFRPVVSSMDAYNYKLTKFLTGMLDPVIPKDHCGKDSFPFCKELKKVSSTKGSLISHDLCSLLAYSSQRNSWLSS